MNIINKCDFAINLVDENGQTIIQWEASETPIHFAVTMQPQDKKLTHGEISVPLMTEKISIYNPQNVPQPTEDTVFIVSRLVKKALPDREDFITNGEALRTGAGMLQGWLNFIS